MEVITFRRLAPLALVVSTVVAQSSRSAPYPPPGKLIDLGGYRVHLDCTGAGTPTVMIAGAGFSFDWDLVQPEIAKFTRVCTYDPAGTAWSDPGPGPACSDRGAEIRRLLRLAEARQPLVLVGLSFGALVARWYASRFPEEVAGMVIVDHPFLENAAPSARALSPDFDRPPALISQTPIVIDSEEDVRALPPRARELHAWALALDPVRPDIETARACLSEITTPASGLPNALGLMPLVVVSTGNLNLDYTNFQKKLLALSQNSSQVIAGRSGHSVELDQPEAIVRAVRQLVALLSR